MEAHPIDNLAAERALAQACYLARVLGTRLRVHSAAGMAKWDTNVRIPGGGLALDSWDPQAQHTAIRQATLYARKEAKDTWYTETKRLHTERLPHLRALGLGA